MPRRDSSRKKSVILGITGASGAVVARRFLQMLEADVRVGKVHLVASKSAVRVAKHELGIEANDPKELPERYNGKRTRKTVCLAEDDIGASIASGSYPIDWMLVAPCSMGTLGRISNGLSSSLIERAADVTLKERRPLVLALRDTPLNRIHLENMLRAHQAGATVFPIIPSFYDGSGTLDEMVTQYCRRVLAHLGLPQTGQYQWKGEPGKGGRGKGKRGKGEPPRSRKR